MRSYEKEPRPLSVVGSLPTYLEGHPALLQELLRSARILEAVALVVCLEQIVNDGRRLPKRDAGVGVLDRRHPAIWVDGCISLFLHFWEGQRLRLVGHAKLLEDDGNFGRVRTLVSLCQSWVFVWIGLVERYPQV